MILVRQTFRHANGSLAKGQSIDIVQRGTDTLVKTVETDSLGSIYTYLDIGQYDFLVLGARIPYDVVGESGDPNQLTLDEHINASQPHPAYDVDMIDMTVLLENGLAG